VTGRTISHNRIYSDQHPVLTAAHETADRGASLRERTIADRVPVTDIMSRDVVCGRPEVGVMTLARLMTEHRIGCVPIVDDRDRPRGVVTRFDLVEALCRTPAGLATLTAKDVMMPLAISLHDRATVAHATALMAREDLHHILIVDAEGVLVGVVSSRDLACWLADNDAPEP
jgi:CBS-domain-containing membrane protein